MNESNRMEIFNGSNYHIWRLKMKAFLKSKKLFKLIIEGHEPAECDDINSTEGKNRLIWEEKNDETFSIIIMSLSSDQAGMFVDEDNAKRIWTALERMYSGNKEDKIIDLLMELKELKMPNNESVDNYITRAKNIIAKINALGGIVKQRELVYYIVRGINQRFENIAVVLRMKRESTLEEVHQALKEEENRTARIVKKGDLFQDVTGEKAFKSREKQFQSKAGGQLRERKECFICRKPGHLAKNCWYRDSEKFQKQHVTNKSKGDRYRPNNTKKWNTASTASGADTDKNTKTREMIDYALCGNENNYKIKSRNKNNNNTKELNSSIWNLDSGCSIHMTAQKNILFNMEEYNSNISMVESGRVIQATGKGELRMSIMMDNQKVNIHMKNVLYVPKLRDNLMSVKELINRGNEVTFNKDGASIYGKKGMLIARAKECNNMFLIEGEILKKQAAIREDVTCEAGIENKVSKLSKNSKQLWHNRLGHLNQNYMDEMKSKCMVKGMEYRSSDILDCEECTLGKMTQCNFKRSMGEYTNKPLELLHIDLCGPLPVKSIGGNRYIFMIVDSYSRRIFIELLKCKSDTFEAFMKFKARRERELDVKVCRVRSDNGTEFVNQKFEEMFKKEGIKHEKTVVYTPQSNGVAEKANRTILDTARTMLLSAGLPARFWGEAVVTAAYLRNCSYRKNLEEKTPMERWNGRKPVLNHLRIFGCVAYCWTNKLHRNKLEPKAQKGIFVGYSRMRKAYRIYLPEQSKIEESRSVKFYEDKRAIDFIDIPDFGTFDVAEIEYSIIEGDNGTSLTEIEDEEQREVEYIIEPENNQMRINEIEDGNEQVQEIDIEQGRNLNRGRPLGTKKDVVAQRNERMNREIEEDLINRGVRRSDRIKEKEQSYQIMEDDEEIPNSFEEAINSKHSKEWKIAMEEELKSLEEHNVWDLVERQDGMKVLRNRWIYSLKYGEGKVIRYKARLVVVGNRQKRGVDYKESYAPVVKIESLRLIIALAARYDLNIYRYDVKTAYLHGDLEEVTYMVQPSGWVQDSKKICKLKKSLYGLPQSGRSWNAKLNKVLVELGLKRLNSDPSVYIAWNKQDFMIMGIYVDDCIVIGTDDAWIASMMKTMQKDFKMREEVGDGMFLGIEIKKVNNGYRIAQEGQIEKLLKNNGMLDCKPVRTPVDTNQKVEEFKDSKNVDVTKYQELIGSLSHISNGTRPDIMFGVNKLAQFNKDPREIHMTAAKRIVRYLKGTQQLGLIYTNDGGNLEASSDASWCSTNDRRSHTGYCVTLGKSLVTWKTRKQELVALSTCEAELNAICETLKEITWISNVLEELNMTEYTKKPVMIWTDSKSAMEWSQGMSVRQRTKHFDRKMYKVREEIEKGNITLVHKPTEVLEADVLTKGVTWEKLQKMRLSIGLQ